MITLNDIEILTLHGLDPCTIHLYSNCPIYNALNIAAHPDLNWKLISVPYYTKDVLVGELTGFAHLDMDVNFD